MPTVMGSSPGVEAVLTRADELAAESRYLDAAEELTRALRNGAARRGVASPAHVERLLNHDRTALTLLDVAAGIDGPDPVTRADQAQTLTNLRRFRSTGRREMLPSERRDPPDGGGRA